MERSSISPAMISPWNVLVLLPAMGKGAHALLRMYGVTTAPTGVVTTLLCVPCAPLHGATCMPLHADGVKMGATAFLNGRQLGDAAMNDQFLRYVYEVPARVPART